MFLIRLVNYTCMQTSKRAPIDLVEFDMFDDNSPAAVGTSSQTGKVRGNKRQRASRQVSFDQLLLFRHV